VAKEFEPRKRVSKLAIGEEHALTATGWRFTAERAIGPADRLARGGLTDLQHRAKIRSFHVESQASAQSPQARSSAVLWPAL
jgi:hypothetical protein